MKILSESDIAGLTTRGKSEVLSGTGWAERSIAMEHSEVGGMHMPPSDIAIRSDFELKFRATVTLPRRYNDHANEAIKITAKTIKRELYSEIVMHLVHIEHEIKNCAQEEALHSVKNLIKELDVS